MTTYGVAPAKNIPFSSKEEIRAYISRNAKQISTTEKVIFFVISIVLQGLMMACFGGLITGLTPKAILAKHITHLAIPLMVSVIPIFYAYLTGRIEGEKFAFDILRPWAAKGVSSWW